MKFFYILSLAFGLSTFAPAQIVTSGSPFYSADEYQRTHQLFEKLHSDLSTAETDVSPDVIDMARNRLNTLENQWDTGVYSSRHMDDTIAALQLVIGHSRLLRDQANIDDDLSRLLTLRREYY